jgi:potassium-dependent mechanosensitive channel
MSDNLTEGILFALLIGVGAFLLNWGLLFLNRYFQKNITVQNFRASLLKLLLRSATVLLQISITTFAFYAVLYQIPSWRPWLVNISLESQRLFTNTITLISTPFYTMGKTEISVRALLQLIILGSLLVVVGRSFREWLKRRILTKLGLEKGDQEAVSAVIFYILMSLGFIVLLQTTGIDLSYLTVVAGVLGIGVGFGLQNLAGNFISGLTILLEQPIKVGDFVEVNGLLGTVEKISVRATVIETQDGVSIIVPNSKFIENNVINWSYGDPSSRVHIPIRVAYNADLSIVTEALLNCARREEKVMSEPAPEVRLCKFGQDSLDFELLVWIEIPQFIDASKSSLNYFIEEEFRMRGIEIPLNQQDINLRSLGDLERFLPALGLNLNQPLVQQAALSSPMQKSLADLLRQVSFFKNCSDVELRVLVERGYRQAFPPEAVICRQGDPGTCFYIILDGTIGVIAEPSGQCLAELGNGNFCGEIALLTGTHRTATLIALTETMLFVIDRNALTSLLKQHKNLAEEISRVLALRTKELKELGLLLDEDPSQLERQDPVTLIRQRLAQLFGI